MTDRQQPVLRKKFVEPGYVCKAGDSINLCTVVASGVVLTVYDRRRKEGGMSHYIRPRREKPRSTAHYAAPAVVSLVQMFLDNGSEPHELEASIFGGAENATVHGYERGLSEDNVQAGREILQKLRVPLVAEDTGGRRARKVIFNSETGESVVARVNKVRREDWYPQVA